MFTSVVKLVGITTYFSSSDTVNILEIKDKQ